MKITVIGAGASGSVLINTLASSQRVERIFCLAKDKNLAKQFVKAHQKVKILACDVNDGGKVEKICRGSDLIINAASPWLNVKILKIALKLRAHYQDLGAYLGFDDGQSKMPYKIEHLVLAKEFKKRKLLAVFDAGASPGLTNLLVAESADRFGVLQRVKIILLEDMQGSAIVSTWSPAALIDEIYSRPVVYRQGKFILLPRFSHPEEFDFPKPFGQRTTYALMNNEAFTIPHYLKVKDIEIRSGGSDDELARLMVGLGLLDKKPRRFGRVTISPLDFMMKFLPTPPTPVELKNLISKGLIKDGFFAFSIIVEVKERQRRQKINYWVLFPSQKELFKRHIYSTHVGYAAGVCASAFALEIPHIKSYGVMAPEAIPQLNRENILSNMKRIGVKIKRTSNN